MKDSSELPLTSLSAAPHVSPSAWRDSEKDWLTRMATWPSHFSAFLIANGPAGWSGRTCLASYQAGQMSRQIKRIPMTRKEIETSLGDLSDLDLEEAAEIETGGVSFFRQTILTPSLVAFGNSGMVAPGESLTLSSSEFRSGAVASSLSDILETGVLPRRFFLTALACLGILRRAAKRGKDLLPRLARALRRVAGLEPTPS